MWAELKIGDEVREVTDAEIRRAHEDTMKQYVGQSRHDADLLAAVVEYFITHCMSKYRGGGCDAPADSPTGCSAIQSEG